MQKRACSEVNLGALAKPEAESSRICRVFLFSNFLTEGSMLAKVIDVLDLKQTCLHKAMLRDKSDYKLSPNTFHQSFSNTSAR